MICWIFKSLAFVLLFRSWVLARRSFRLMSAKVSHSMQIGDVRDDVQKSIWFLSDIFVLNCDIIDFQVETIRIESWRAGDYRDVCCWLLNPFSYFSIMVVMNWSIWFRFNYSVAVSLRLLLIIKIVLIFVSILFLVIFSASSVYTSLHI